MAGAAAAPAPAGQVLYVPKQAVHSTFVIEVNGKGQVSRVRSRVTSGDRRFDGMTYGNVVQTFVRKPDGSAVPGVYRMTYAFDPKTKNVRRTVVLIAAGGVNPAAESLVDRMAESNRHAAEAIQKALEAGAKPMPQVPLPFLSPTPKPKS